MARFRLRTCDFDVDTSCSAHYTSCMVTPQPQLHVKLSAKDAASLRKLARAEKLSLSQTVRLLIRRSVVAMRAP
jgi:hypothetical protein